MEEAKLALSRAKAAAHGEMQKYRSKMKLADAIDSQAYGSRRQRQASEDKTYIMEKATVQDEQARAASDAEMATQVANKNTGYMKAADTVAETSSFNDGTSMMA